MDKLRLSLYHIAIELSWSFGFYLNISGFYSLMIEARDQDKKGETPIYELHIRAECSRYLFASNNYYPVVH